MCFFNQTADVVSSENNYDCTYDGIVLVGCHNKRLILSEFFSVIFSIIIFIDRSLRSQQRWTENVCSMKLSCFISAEDTSN